MLLATPAHGEGENGEDLPITAPCNSERMQSWKGVRNETLQSGSHFFHRKTVSSSFDTASDPHGEHYKHR